MHCKATFAVLLAVLAFTWAGEKCCRDIGCFDNTSGPMSNFPEPDCPEDIGMKYYLFTRKNPEYKDAVELTLDHIPVHRGETGWANALVNPSKIADVGSGPRGKSLFDPKKLTIWTSHGWMGESDMDWTNELVSAMLGRLDANVISVDWQEGSKKVYYPKAASTVQTVGAAMALTMQGLVDHHGVSYDNMWCAGFSLGAHVCGHAGMKSGGQLDRVTGLDPAGPWFGGRDVRNGINPMSAKFVDIIHTDGAGIISYYGLMERRGHADFYPNGGRDQHGCYFGRRRRALPPKIQDHNDVPGHECIDFNGWVDLDSCPTPYNAFIGCSHYRAVYFFIESFTHENCHVAKQKCTDYNKLPQTCSSIEHTEMGLLADKNIHKEGIFYLETGKKQPYCRYA